MRLTFADGTILEDVVAHGVALFFAPSAVACPAQVEMLDRAGTTLARYSEFDDFA